MIHQNRKLSSEQLEALLALRFDCQAFDGNMTPIYPHLLAFERPHAGNFLYYHNGLLIGFLAVFFFYEQAVEISLLVHPRWRKKGIAQQLLKACYPMCAAEALTALYFSRPQGLSSQPLQALDCVYASSEYHLSLSPRPALSVPTALQIRQAKWPDLTQLSAIDAICFGEDDSNTLQLQGLLVDSAYLLLVGEIDGLVVSKVHLLMQNEVILSNLAVLPEWRGRGYGRALIEASIASMLTFKKEKLCLDVESNNKRALDLYLQCGFCITDACDYFISDFSKFQAYCSDKS